MSGITFFTARTLHTFVGSSGHCFGMLMVPCSHSCGTNTRRPLSLLLAAILTMADDSSMDTSPS